MLLLTVFTTMVFAVTLPTAGFPFLYKNPMFGHMAKFVDDNRFHTGGVTANNLMKHRARCVLFYVRTSSYHLGLHTPSLRSRSFVSKTHLYTVCARSSQPSARQCTTHARATSTRLTLTLVADTVSFFTDAPFLSGAGPRVSTLRRARTRPCPPREADTLSRGDETSQVGVPGMLATLAC